MLSISNVAEGKGVADYYEQKDDYYIRGTAKGCWFGRGAESLALNQVVDGSMFIAVLAGKLPDGTTIHRAAGGHRGGLDLTFSAPKSVSLMGIMAGDQRIFEAHTKAVLNTLRIAESLAGYRVTADGKTEHQISGNLIGAKFDHELSRACDPQLHSHCVVMNATKRYDGQWRALDNEPLYRSKMLLGAAYRTELAQALQTLGYEINVTHNDGRFELVGWEPRALQEFSQRSRAIEEFLKKNSAFPNSASAVEKKMAALATRADKGDVDPDALAAVWEARLKDLGIFIPEIPYSKITDDVTYSSKSAKKILDQALLHLSERESAFTKAELVCAALQFGVGVTTHVHILVEIEKRIAEKALFSDGSLMTTPELMKEELEILKAEIRERGVLPSLCGSLPLIFSPNNLTNEQATAVYAIVASNSRLIGLVGKAGTGKTTTLKTAVKYLKTKNVKVFGIAPSSNASKLLAEAGLETATVSMFNVNNLYKKVSKGGVLIVDESGMLATKQLMTLIDQACQHDFRLVLVGDPKQLAAVEAGKPYAQLIKSGMPISTLKKIHRQTDQLLMEAVEFASVGEISAALGKIKHWVTEIPNRDQRLEEISAAYAQLSSEEQKKTIVVAGTRSARERINHSIRGKLGLAGNGFAINILESKNLTKQQAASISSYEVDDVLTANRDYKSLDLKRGEQATVVGLTATSVLLTTRDGRQLEWRPTLAPDLAASRCIAREVSVGDSLRATSNMHSLGLINGDEFQVNLVDSKKMLCTIELKNGLKKVLNLTNPLAIDHAYCKTVYASQGATCDRVFIEADASSLTAHQATFYVAISRARTEVKIFTNDAQALGPAMSRPMEKKSALEVESRKVEQETREIQIF